LNPIDFSKMYIDDNQNLQQNEDNLSEKMILEVEFLKNNFDMIHKKHLDIISQINSDSTHLTLTRLESDLLNIKTEIISIKKSLQDVNHTIQPEKLNSKINDFKIEIDNIVKSIKHDIRTENFESKISDLQKQIDSVLKNTNSVSNKFDKNGFNKINSDKKGEDVNHLSVEIQRVFDRFKQSV